MIKADNYEKILRKKIIELAFLQYYKKYEHGMHGPNSFDCAGLPWFLYHEICDIDIYDNGFGLSTTTTKIMTSSYGNLRIFVENDYNKDLNLIKSGDILFFHRQSYNDSLPKEDNRYPGHFGIYLSDNYFIQSSSVIGKIIISNFELNDYWKKVFGRK